MQESRLANYSDCFVVKHSHFCPQLTQELSAYCETSVINAANAPICSLLVLHSKQRFGTLLVFCYAECFCHHLCGPCG